MWSGRSTTSTSRRATASAWRSARVRSRKRSAITFSAGASRPGVSVVARSSARVRNSARAASSVIGSPASWITARCCREISPRSSASTPAGNRVHRSAASDISRVTVHSDTRVEVARSATSARRSSSARRPCSGVARAGRATAAAASAINRISAASAAARARRPASNPATSRIPHDHFRRHRVSTGGTGGIERSDGRHEDSQTGGRPGKEILAHQRRTPWPTSPRLPAAPSLTAPIARSLTHSVESLDLQAYRRFVRLMQEQMYEYPT